MEESIEYMTDLMVRPTGRRGKIFIGGYIDSAMAERLHKVRELNGWTMVELFEHMAESAIGTFVAQGCCHE